MMRILLPLVCLLAFSNNTKAVELGANLIKNGSFEEKLQFWQVESPINWQPKKGVEDSGSLFMNAKYAPKSPYVREFHAKQCIKIGNAAKISILASFRYDSLPELSHGHRANLIWFQDDNCTSGGNFGFYLEPKIVLGWQNLQWDSLLPSLNARSVQVLVTQSQRYSKEQLGYFEQLWVKVLTFLGIKYWPELSSGYWDNFALKATELSKTSIATVEAENPYTLTKGENYIQNGSFDDNIKFWKVHYKSDWMRDVGYEKKGSLLTKYKSLSGGGTGAFGQCVNFGTELLFEMGVRARVSEESNQEGGGRFRPTWFENLDCEGRAKISTKHDDLTPVKSWQYLKVTDLKPPKGARSIYIEGIHVLKGEGQFLVHWDDVYFKSI